MLEILKNARIRIRCLFVVWEMLDFCIKFLKVLDF